MVIGGEDVSLISDNSIKDVLWEYYLDVEKTIQWAVGSLKVCSTSEHDLKKH